MDHKPCLDIFLVGLSHFKLRGPLAVIALVSGSDTWLRNTCRQFAPVHLLNGLQFKPGSAGTVGCDEILRKLRVRSCGRSEYRFDLTLEDRIFSVTPRDYFGYAEDTASLTVLCKSPVEELSVRYQTHKITHDITSFRFADSFTSCLFTDTSQGCTLCD